MLGGPDHHRVLAREARVAERRGGRARGHEQAIELEVAERVDAEVVTDLADGKVRGQELGAAPGVHAVMARPSIRRRRHPEVDLGRTRLAQHLHHRARGRAPHDRVVDDDEPLALDVLGQGVQLHAHALAAEALAGLDERPVDVAVLHQAVAVGDAGLAREPLRGGDPRLGHRHDHVGFRGRLAGECLAHALPRGVHALAVEGGVGPREVDELEQTQLRVSFRVAPFVDPQRVDDDHLAGLDVAHEVRTHDVEGRRLACEHEAAFDAAEHERPDPVGIANADEVRLVHDHERERAFEVGQHPLEGDLEVAPVRAQLSTELAPRAARP